MRSRVDIALRRWPALRWRIRRSLEFLKDVVDNDGDGFWPDGRRLEGGKEGRLSLAGEARERLTKFMVCFS